MATITYHSGVNGVLVIPDQCTSVTITAKGAGGGGLTGGAGDYVKATFPVTSGDTLYIRAGGQGFVPLYGDGGLGGAGSGQGGTAPGGDSHCGAGGGGMSDVRLNADTLAAQILVAGGGGGRNSLAGSVNYIGGAGGANTGEDGHGQVGGPVGTNDAYGGLGGSQVAGGVGGGPGAGATGSGANGSRGQGGHGSRHTASGLGAGGGGGGGYYGGGGGGGAGSPHSGAAGGGGSGFVDPSGTSVTHTRGGGAPAATNGDITVELNYPPDAPELDALSDIDVDVTLPVTRGWTFSDPDPDDEQTQADARWRVGVGAWNTIAAAVGDDTPSYDFTAGLFASYVDQSVEYEIKTYDLLGASSPWSTSGYFTPRDAPTDPTFTSTPVIDSHTPTVVVGFPDGALGVEYRLTHDVAGSPGADILYTSAAFGAVTTEDTRTLRDDPLDEITNGVSYHILVRYFRHAHVYSAWVDSGPVVGDISAPLQPTCVATGVDSTASVFLQITNPGSDPNPPSYNDVYRQDLSLGTPEERIATGVPLNSTYTDWQAGLHHRLRYRVAAVTDTGAFTYSE